jgi:hypothetical protein
MVDKDEWTNDVEIILDKIRQNCVVLCEQHKQQYFYLQSWLKYFRLPCIVLSSINAVASIGLQAYLAQRHVSLINCLISLVTTIITSTELYLQIEKQMSTELEVSRDYYLLSIDIHKILGLNKENRNIDASTYLDSCMSGYKNLFMHSMVLEKRLKDKLISLDCDMIMPELPGMSDMACKGSDDIIESARNNDYFIDICNLEEKDKKEEEIIKKEDELAKKDNNEIKASPIPKELNLEPTATKEPLIIEEDDCLYVVSLCV